MARRFETLGATVYKEETVEFVENSLSYFRGVGNHPPDKNQISMRQHDVSTALELCFLTHLEVDATGFDLQQYAEQGARVAVDYFYGEYLLTIDKAVRKMRKAPDNESLKWYQVERDGLLLTMLAADREAERRLVEWVEPWLPFDESSYLVKPEDNAYLKLLAEHLREGSFATMSLRDEILAKRSKRPKLLLACLEAVQARDGGAFAKKLREYLAYFLKSDFGDGGFANLFSIDGSILVEVARRAGLEPSGLSEKESALIMTRQTLGLA